MTADPLARVASGWLRGSRTAHGARFLSVPFARPPVGELRWQPPQPAPRWDGVRDATRRPPACPQLPDTGTQRTHAQLAQRFGFTLHEAPLTMSEDCLHVNVWVPQWPMPEPRPVMVWLHGGGNATGTAADPIFDGEALAARGVVVVSAGYRLGPLGFLALPELDGAEPSGNAGLRDQVAALRWVQESISAFGGDPDRVTAFGQSAGASAVGLFMTMPSTDGLFHRAIAQSGAAIAGIGVSTIAEMQTLSLAVAERLGIRERGHRLVRRLRSTPAAELQRAAIAVSGHPAGGWGPAVDGALLPAPAIDAFRRGTQRPVDLLIGFNARETSTKGDLLPAIADLASFHETIAARYGPAAAQAQALYDVDAHGDLAAAVDAWWTDLLFACPTAAMAAAHAAAGHRAFVYEFARVLDVPAARDVGAPHEIELPYVFGTFGVGDWAWVPARAEDHRLSDQMQRSWARFAATGDPNGPDLPRWPRFDGARGGHVVFGDDGARPAWRLRAEARRLYDAAHR